MFCFSTQPFNSHPTGRILTPANIQSTVKHHLGYYYSHPERQNVVQGSFSIKAMVLKNFHDFFLAHSKIEKHPTSCQN